MTTIFASIKIYFSKFSNFLNNLIMLLYYFIFLRSNNISCKTKWIMSKLQIYCWSFCTGWKITTPMKSKTIKNYKSICRYNCFNIIIFQSQKGFFFFINLKNFILLFLICKTFLIFIPKSLNRKTVCSRWKIKRRSFFCYIFTKRFNFIYWTWT